MQAPTRNRRNLSAGFFFVAMGIAFAYGSGVYEIGSASAMGPGYFPRLVGILSILLGLGVLAKAYFGRANADGRIGAWAWKELSLILSANFLFGLLLGGLPSINLPSLGFVAAIYVSVLVASLASGRFRLKEYLVLSTVLAAGVYVICITILNFYVPIWPVFLK